MENTQDLLGCSKKGKYLADKKLNKLLLKMPKYKLINYVKESVK